MYKNEYNTTVAIAGTLRLSQPCRVIVSAIAVHKEIIRLILIASAAGNKVTRFNQIKQTRSAVIKKEIEPARVFCPPKNCFVL